MSDPNFRNRTKHDGYRARLAADIPKGPLRASSLGLIEVAAAINAFARSIELAATDYDNFTEDEKARAKTLISKGIGHISELWKGMLKNG